MRALQEQKADNNMCYRQCDAMRARCSILRLLSPRPPPAFD
jgi:hypothetical protein